MPARAVKGQSFQVVQLPDRVPAMEPARAQCFAAGIPAGAEGEQTEGLVFFIFNHQEAPVRQLLHGGGFVEAREGLENGCEVWCHVHILINFFLDRAELFAREYGRNYWPRLLVLERHSHSPVKPNAA